ncbi:MAG: 50S ribosomal protein L18 [Verrucomicrobiota bacterium]
MKESQNRKEIRERLHTRIRKKVTGTGKRPRLSVYFSGQNIYAQVIDDEKQCTLLAVATTEKALKKLRPNAASAAQVGKLLAERAKSKGVSEVVFDRGGFKYHGKVKALADAAREGGLKF